MKNYLKYIFLAVYCVIGITGWYKYATLHSQQQMQGRLSSELTVSYVRAIVWYHSRGKLQELRFIIDDDDLTEEQRIKTRITNMLKHRTSVYIRDLNSLNTPMDNLGSWYEVNFDFDNFLKEVFDIVFNKNYSTDEKINYVTDVMEKHQNVTTQKLITTMK